MTETEPPSLRFKLLQQARLIEAQKRKYKEQGKKLYRKRRERLMDFKDRELIKEIIYRRVKALLSLTVKIMDKLRSR